MGTQIVTIVDRDNNVKVPRTIDSAVTLTDGRGQTLSDRLKEITLTYATQQDIKDALVNLQLDIINLDYATLNLNDEVYNFRVFLYNTVTSVIIDSTDYDTQNTNIKRAIPYLKNLNRHLENFLNDNHFSTENIFTDSSVLSNVLNTVRIFLDSEEFPDPSDNNSDILLNVTIHSSITNDNFRCIIYRDNLNSTITEKYFNAEVTTTSSKFGELKILVKKIGFTETSNKEYIEASESSKKFIVTRGDEKALILGEDGTSIVEPLDTFTTRTHSDLTSIKERLTAVEENVPEIDYNNLLNKPEIPFINFKCVTNNEFNISYNCSILENSQYKSDIILNTDDIIYICRQSSVIRNHIVTYIQDNNFNRKELLNTLKQEKNTDISVLCKTVSTALENVTLESSQSILLEIKATGSQRYLISLTRGEMLNISLTISDPLIGEVLIQTIFDSSEVAAVNLANSYDRTFMTINDLEKSTNITVEENKSLEDFYSEYKNTITDISDSINNIEENKFTGDYNDLTNKPSIPDTKGLATTEYVNSAIASSISSVPTIVISTSDAPATGTPNSIWIKIK